MEQTTYLFQWKTTIFIWKQIYKFSEKFDLFHSTLVAFHLEHMEWFNNLGALIVCVAFFCSNTKVEKH